jgi:hypothetical protein
MEYINLHAAVGKAYQSLSAPPQSSSTKPSLSSGAGAAGGMLAFIIIIVLVELGLAIWAIVALVRFWRFLPTIAGVISILLLIFGFPMFSLLVTYMTKRV